MSELRRLRCCASSSEETSCICTCISHVAAAEGLTLTQNHHKAEEEARASLKTRPETSATEASPARYSASYAVELGASLPGKRMSSRGSAPSGEGRSAVHSSLSRPASSDKVKRPASGLLSTQEVLPRRSALPARNERGNAIELVTVV
jgi:hypothetical protein